MTLELYPNPTLGLFSLFLGRHVYWCCYLGMTARNIFSGRRETRQRKRWGTLSRHCQWGTNISIRSSYFLQLSSESVRVNRQKRMALTSLPCSLTEAWPQQCYDFPGARDPGLEKKKAGMYMGEEVPIGCLVLPDFALPWMIKLLAGEARKMS